jgi:hypothetical protein
VVAVGLKIKRADIYAIDQDPATLEFIESGDQPGNGGLPRAGMSNKSDIFPWSDR